MGGPVRRRFLLQVAVAVIAAGLLLFGPGMDSAMADVVGTGYADADLVDLQWATDHLGYTTPGELQRAGVSVVDFILSISGRTGLECDLGYADQLDPLGTHRFATTWSGAEMATLDRVAAHYCVSQQQAQAFGATILTFFAGLDAGANGTDAVRRTVVEIAPGPPAVSVLLTGSGNRAVMLDEPPPADHRVVAYDHAGAGSFRVVGLDVSGEEVEVLVARDGVVSGRVLIDESTAISSVAVMADGEWSVAFESVLASPVLDVAEPVIGSGDTVFLVPVELGGMAPRYRHVGEGVITIRSLGPGLMVADVLASAEGSVVSRLRLPAGGRVLGVEATGEWALVDGDLLPPGQPVDHLVVAGDRLIEVTWTAPPSGGSAITAFEIAHRPVPAGDDVGAWTVVEVAGTTRAITVRDLKNGLARQVRIRAVNDVGAGLWTWTLATAPMAPVEVVVVTDGLAATAGDRQVSLAWVAPVDVEVSSYSIVYFDESRVLSGTAVIRGATTTRRGTQVGRPPPSVLARRGMPRVSHLGAGIRMPMIVGGSPAVAGSTTHAVALLVSGQSDPFQAHYCGGTLVAPRWVVTAAHCLTDKTVDVVQVAGLVDLDEVSPSDRIAVNAIHVHEGYDAERILNDIGLIELATDAPGTAIPWQTDGELPIAGTALQVAGWGAVSADGELYESGLRTSVGRALGGPADAYCGAWRGFDANLELCVGSPGGDGACSGDSGGPVSASLGMTRLVGVTSYGLSGECADRTYPNVATRVSGHADWIRLRVGDPWQTIEGLTTPTHSVDGLVNGRIYTFHVTAVDTMGRSVSPMAITVAPVGPPGAPTGLTGQGGDSSAVLSWESAFSAADDPVTNHIVQYSIDGLIWTTVEDLVTSGTVSTVSGLVNETILWFRVMAVNGRGTGPASNETVVVVGQPDVSTGLVGIAGDGRVDLSWTAPADDGGSAIVDYVVERLVDTGWEPVADGISSTPAAAVDGLVNGAREDFRVSAVTAVGRGPASGVVTIIPGRPAPPTGLRVEPGDGSAILTWTASAHNGGSPVVNHRIEFSVDDGATWDLVGGEVGTVTTVTVDGLRNGVSHRLRVSAVTALGTSRTTSMEVVPASVPGVASSLMVSGEHESLVFTWNRPGDGGSPIIGIHIELRRVGLVEWQSFAAGPLTTTARVGGLTSGMEYEVRVTVENALGRGPSSAVVRVVAG
jgi:hypothetical protein